MADRTVSVRLQAEVAQYNQAMGQAATSTSKVGDAGEKSGKTVSERVGGAAKTVGALTAVAAAAGVALVKNAVSTGVAYNQLEQTARASFTTLLGSQQAADKMMSSIADFAKTSPFPRQAFIEGTQQLLAFGMQAENVIPTMGAVQDAVAAAGGSSQDLSEIIYVLAQAQSQGKMTGTTLLQLGKHGINAADLIGSSMGKTAQQIKTDITNGTMDATTAIDALVSGMNSRFGGAAENVKKTWVGATDRIKGAWRDISSILVEPFVSKGGGGLALDWANSFADLLRSIEKKAQPVVDILMRGLGPAAQSLTDMLVRAKTAVDGWSIGKVTTQVDKLVSYTPMIGGLATGLISFATKSLPFLSKLPFSINPIATGIGMLIALSPELRGVAMELLGALEPLVPVAGRVVGAFADLAVGGIGLVTPLISALVPPITGLVTLIGKVPTPILAAVAAFAGLKALNIGGTFQPLLNAFQKIKDYPLDKILAKPMANMGQVLQGASASTMALGKNTGLMSTALGAAKGAVNGVAGALKAAFISNPVGLIITAITTALTVFSQAAANAKARSDAYADSIDKMTGEVTGSAREVAAAALTLNENADWGWFQKMQTGCDTAGEAIEKMGLSVQDATAAITGTDAEFEAYVQSVRDVAAANGEHNSRAAEVITKLHQQREALQDQVKAQNAYREATDDGTASVKEAVSAAKGQSSALGELLEKTVEGTATTHDFTSAIEGLLSAQAELAGITLSARAAEREFEASLQTANQALQDQIDSLTEQYVAQGMSKDAALAQAQADIAAGAALDISTEAGRKNQAALDGIAKSALDLIQAKAKEGASEQELTQLMTRAREQYISAAMAQGMSADAAQRLADKMRLVPSQVSTVFDVATSAAQGDVDRFVSRNSGRVVKLYVDAVTRNTTFAVGPGAAGRVTASQWAGGWAGKHTPGGILALAGGGWVPGVPPSNPRADNVLALHEGGLVALRSREFVVNEPAAALNASALEAANRGARLVAVPGFAGGGALSGQPVRTASLLGSGFDLGQARLEDRRGGTTVSYSFTNFYPQAEPNSKAVDRAAKATSGLASL